MSIASSWSLPFLRTLFKQQKPLFNLFYHDAISTTTSTTRQRFDNSKTSAKHSYLGRWLKAANLRNANYKQGQVFIVGAGPGDAELLTLKALRLLQQADVVLFDALVSEDILALIPSKVVKEYVGKRCKKHWPMSDVWH